MRLPPLSTVKTLLEELFPSIRKVATVDDRGAGIGVRRGESERTAADEGHTVIVSAIADRDLDRWICRGSRRSSHSSRG